MKKVGKTEETMWIKNSSGRPDAMLTFATISFAIVSLNILLSTIQEIAFLSGSSMTFQIMDAGTMTAYLAATFSAYVSRRWTDRKYIDSPVTNSDDSSENE